MVQPDNPPAEAPPPRVWRHKSILALLAHHRPAKDPIELIRRLARDTVRKAKASQWQGPPFQPAELASFLGINVEPASSDIRADARIFPDEHGELRLEYDPANPPQRIRFSICHEIVHTFFPDCYEAIHHRDPKREFDPIHAEFEMLCNIGAAELLMPWDDFTAAVQAGPIDAVLVARLRKNFDVSTEACLHRIVDLSDWPCAVVFFEERYSKKERRMGAGTVRELDLGIAKQAPKLRVAYSRGSKDWRSYIPKNKSIPIPDSAVHRCVGTAGFAQGQELWDFLGLHLSVLAVELPLVLVKDYPTVAAYIEPLR